MLEDRPDPIIPGVVPNEISGYTDQLSYSIGDTLLAFISADTGYVDASIRLFDYSANLIDSIRSPLDKQFPMNEMAWANGFGYNVSFEYIIPALKSGVYFWEEEIPFFIKASAQSAAIKVVHPSNTANAYGNAGGKSLYGYNSTDGISSDSVSFLRPITLDKFSINCLRTFTASVGYDIGYLVDSDMEDMSNLNGTELLIIIGHSEYWTRAARLNFDRFVDGGGNALVLSGNSMWWQSRYSSEGDKLIVYKNSDEDPIDDPLLKTILWNDVSLGYSIFSSIGVDFHFGGYGTTENDRGWDGFKIINADRPYFAGTELVRDSILYINSFEYDGTQLVGFDSDGYPIPDTTALGFHEMKIIGFDHGYYSGGKVGTWIEFRKTPSSGIIINVSSTDWCSRDGMGGPSGDLVEQLTYNMIDYLLSE